MPDSQSINATPSLFQKGLVRHGISMPRPAAIAAPVRKALGLETSRSIPQRPDSTEIPLTTVSASIISDPTTPQSPSPDDPESVEHQVLQPRPDVFPNLAAEATFVLVCSFGMLFSISQGTVGSVLQVNLVAALGLQTTQAPWIIGAFFLASGLSVIVSGALADLTPPKRLMLFAFAWATVWSLIGAFSITPQRKILFFVMRAMQGVACGALSSVPMSILGRVYKPGQRKNRAFAVIGAMAPIGALLGTLQGGALQAHLPWVFGSSAIVCAVLLLVTLLVVPALQPEAESPAATEADVATTPPSLKDFDALGALLALLGCGCVLGGLTQGSPSGWSPYTYALIIVGVILLAVFAWYERRPQRPLISPRLWQAPGFAPLSLAYFLGFGSFLGCYQFYSYRYWLTLQHAPPVLLAAYKSPDAIAGVVATFVVAKILHRVRGHYILIAAMLFYAAGPAFFLWQQPWYPYWTVLPGVALAALGPDLSFTAAAVFITSAVPKSYQGSAGSVLVTIQNVSAAVVTSVADSVAAAVTRLPDGELDLQALRATWWLGLGLALAAAVLCIFGLRIPETKEKEHVA